MLSQSVIGECYHKGLSDSVIIKCYQIVLSHSVIRECYPSVITKVCQRVLSPGFVICAPKLLVTCKVTPAIWLNLSDSRNILIIHFGLLLKEHALDSIGHDLWKKYIT